METIISFLNYQPFGEYNTTAAVIALIYGIFGYIVYNVYVLWDINDICKDHRKITIIPKSISDTYYEIEVRWLFQMFMVSSIFSILCMGQNILYTIVAVFFSVMTVNPSVRSGDRYLIPHMIGAITATVLALLGLGISFGTWSMPICVACALVPIVITERKDPSIIYIVEQICFISLMIGFLLSIVC